MNYQALKAEAALPAYAGMTDAEILASLAALSVPQVRNVEASAVRGDFLADPEMAWGWICVVCNMQLTLADAALLPVQALSFTVRDTLLASSTLEATDEAKWGAMQAALDGLLAARTATGLPLMSDALRAAIVARREVLIARWQEIGLPRQPDGEDLKTARLV